MKYEELEPYKDDKNYIFSVHKAHTPHKTQYIAELSANIDEEIVNLIKLLNHLGGVKTFSSCQGIGPGEYNYLGSKNNCMAYVGFVCCSVTAMEEIKKLSKKTFYESGDNVIFEEHIHYLKPHTHTECFVRFYSKKARDIFTFHLNSAFEEFSSNQD